MKKLLVISLLFIGLSSCKKEEEVKPSYADCAAIQNAISISDARIRQLQTNLAQASLESRERIIKSIAAERSNNSNLLNQKASMGC